MRLDHAADWLDGKAEMFHPRGVHVCNEFLAEAKHYRAVAAILRRCDTLLGRAALHCEKEVPATSKALRDALEDAAEIVQDMAKYFHETHGVPHA
jgi:hypothetical protein